MSSNDVVLCSALRSPIGRFQGTLAAIRPDDLLARLFEAVKERTNENDSGTASVCQEESTVYQES